MSTTDHSVRKHHFLHEDINGR